MLFKLGSIKIKVKFSRGENTENDRILYCIIEVGIAVVIQQTCRETGKATSPDSEHSKGQTI